MNGKTSQFKYGKEVPLLLLVQLSSKKLLLSLQVGMLKTTIQWRRRSKMPWPWKENSPRDKRRGRMFKNCTLS